MLKTCWHHAQPQSFLPAKLKIKHLLVGESQPWYGTQPGVCAPWKLSFASYEERVKPTGKTQCELRCVVTALCTVQLATPCWTGHGRCLVLWKACDGFWMSLWWCLQGRKNHFLNCDALNVAPLTAAVMMSVMILLLLMVLVTLQIQNCSASEPFKKHPSYFTGEYKILIWISGTLHTCMWLFPSLGVNQISVYSAA